MAEDSSRVRQLRRREFLGRTIAIAGSVAAADLLRQLTPVGRVLASHARPRGTQKLIIGMSRDPDTLDVNVSVFGHVHRVMGQTFEPLIWEAKDGTFVGGLAESWQISQDGKHFTFRLRNGVKFHDGTAFNAEAVKFAFDRIADPATKSRRAINLIGPYASSDVLDQFTIRVNLKERFAPFLDGISQAFVGVPSPSAVKKYGGDFGRNPVGTGPLIFKEWVRQDHVTLVRNPAYNWPPRIFKHQGPIELEEVTWRIIPESGTRIGALEAGELNMVDFVTDADISRLRQNPNLVVMVRPVPGFAFLYIINTERFPTDDVRIRKALQFATNKDEINRVVYKGNRAIAHGVLASPTPGYSKEVEGMYKYDPARAKQLLSEAGWEDRDGDGIRERDGKPLVLGLYDLVVRPETELLQAQLKAVGIKVEIRTGTDSWWQESGIRGDHHLIIEGVSGSDPAVLGWQLHSRHIGVGFNRARFRNARLDLVLDLGQRVTDWSLRKKHYAEAQKIIMENALVLPLTEQTNNIAFRKEVKGVDLDIRGWYTWLYDAYIER